MASHSSQFQIQIQLQILTQDHQKAQATAGNQKHTIFDDFFQNLQTKIVNDKYQLSSDTMI